MYTNNRDIPKSLRKLIKDRGEVISVVADGHCLFRAVGKILRMEPGAVMKEAKFENVKHNENGPDIHESEWGGTEDCQIIARWCKRDVVILHTKTDRGTVVPYTYNEIGARANHTPHGRMWMDGHSTREKLYLPNI
jgi:hypothetical protein